MYNLNKKRDLEKEGVAPVGRKYLYNFDVAMYDYIIRTLKPFFREGPALELGCYKGVFTQKLSGLFSDLTAIDGSVEAVEQTREAAPRVLVKQAMIEKYSSDKKYNNIFLMHTLEHVDDAVVALKNIRTLLSDNGRLFIVVPNANALSRQIAVEMGILAETESVASWERAVGHQRTYISATLFTDISAAGLVEETSGGVFVKPLCNAQFDELGRDDKIVTPAYREACYRLSVRHPHLCASLYSVCGRGE